MQSVPNNKQRGFYSDILSKEGAPDLSSINQGPEVAHSTLWNVTKEKHRPKASSFKIPDDFDEQLEKQIYGPSTQIAQNTDYPMSSWEPKVQMPYYTPPGNTPRKVAIERLRRKFESLNIESLLLDAGVETDQLMPKDEVSARINLPSPVNASLTVKSQSSSRASSAASLKEAGIKVVCPNGERKNKGLFDGNSLLTNRKSAPVNQGPPAAGPLHQYFPIYLPLEIFDNEEYDCHTPDEWISRLYDEDGSAKAVPGKALLKTLITRENQSQIGSSATAANDPTPSPLLPIPSWQWVDVGVLAYSPRTKRYLVQRANMGLSWRHPAPNGGLANSLDGTPANTGDCKDGNRYWVPRVRLLFAAENPYRFTRRVVEAHKLRLDSESVIRYQMYVDCMHTKSVPDIDKQMLDNITNHALGACKLDGSKLSWLVQRLRKQISLDYQRAHNRIAFDSVAHTLPGSFTYVTIPDVPEICKSAARIDIPKYPFHRQFDSFIFNSFLTRPEAIMSLGDVRAECNKVSSKDLFQTQITKSMRLEEFEQTQNQSCMQVQSYLKDTWLTTLCTRVTSSLRDVGKGWFNIEENKWEVYEISKLRKFMELVKFAMQDSLRYLVEQSLEEFAHIITDTTISVMELKEGMEWPHKGNLAVSPYQPLKNPLFVIDLILDQEGIRYSTPLENFESTIVSVFDRGIFVTQSIPQLEKRVMSKLFWAGCPMLESVGAHEPHVEILRSKIRKGITQALIPLRAYLKRYEKFRPLAELNVADYLKSIMEKDMSAYDVKREIEIHQQEKESLEADIPSSIVIGPFWINCDTVRNFLVKKRRELAKAVLELLAKKLRTQTEEICEEFKVVSRKLFDRPNAIEDAAEMREYIRSLPDTITQNQQKIDKVMSDYELLEDFYYNLSTDDFNAKWTCFAWPAKIDDLIDRTNENLTQDEERFSKILSSDQANFEDKMDSLQMTVAGFSGHSDINKALEISLDVKRISNQLKECQTLAQLYNQRERLFGTPVTQYDKVNKLIREFEPYKNLWTTTADWQKCHESWMNEPLNKIDPEFLEQNISTSYKTMHKCIKVFKDNPGCLAVAQEIRHQLEEFKPKVPLIQGLRNPGMRNRHWESLSDDIGIVVKPKSSLTFSKCLDMGLMDHVDQIAKIAEVAGKEFAIEQCLEKMEKDWAPVNLEILAYKETGTYIMKAAEEISQLLDDHIVMTQSMSFSPYKKPFENRIMNWESKLRMTQDVMEEWATCQRAWLYLEPIFSSEDINRQLPVESKRYQTMDRMWRKMMAMAANNPNVITFCPDARLLENFRECNKLLEQVQKGLSEYLETKRASFPRFYFLSDDELLEILSQTKDPTAVQPHLRKCFEAIAKLTFQEDLKITAMHSMDGESVPFSETLYPTGNVEDWLLEVERVMRQSILESVKLSVEDYPRNNPQTARTEWVLNWPGQVVIAGCQIFWTKEVTEAIEGNDLPGYYDKLMDQLADLVNLVRGNLSAICRAVMSALIVVEVHARDVTANLIEVGVKNLNDFEWIQQMRYYWDEELLSRVVNSEFKYGYEYLGNSGRLVITPLTDRCYLTLCGALHLKFGGAPAGPAGTGKTETTKDLAKALAYQCVVFNCSDQLDFMAMGKFFKGLASAGAWACFDEFNRIDIEVLSVVAQQITTIQKAQIQKLERFMFEGVEIVLKASCSVFITMNPGYAGRTELPDNLKALFRPVAMMVPDYAMIAEISLFSFGFSDAKVLSKKITSTFKLSSEQLSAQDHYDFGMRAVKTVISAAANLKRDLQDTSEELICLRAIRDVNVPKFLQDDLKLFNGIVSDLFPKIKQEAIDYGDLDTSIKKTCAKKNLLAVDGFMNKCIQLYETTVVRHGLMLVGPTGSGKTRCYEVLQEAMTDIKGYSIGAYTFEKVITYVLNPKSITMGQLYGEFDAMTHEWTDGILSSLIRLGSSSTETTRRWYVFDGPVDAVWIENMNTVLDDNKKLCLSSGEIIKLTDYMTMMFEVADLAEASPATVSRCGMVYLEPQILGHTPFVTCWLNTLPEIMKPYREHLQTLFDTYLEGALKALRKNCKEMLTTMNSSLIDSTNRYMECFFAPFTKTEGPQIPEEKSAMIPMLIEPWFIFSLTWAIPACCDSDGRKNFSLWLRGAMKDANAQMPYPEAGQVFDYKLDDGGASIFDDDEEEIKDRKICWEMWTKEMPELNITPESKFQDIIVPTMDTIRSEYLIEMLLVNKKQLMCIGPTGTGKSLTIANKLSLGMSEEYISNFLMFSARTSANQTQDIIDSKLDKRRKGVFGPPLGKEFVFFIDDFNMPALEVYGAQPPIELIRQWLDHKGWYDRKVIGAFKNLVDINFLVALGPPGGGRNPLTSRIVRHFNLLTFCNLQDDSKERIFGTILANHLSSMPGGGAEFSGNVSKATIMVYNTICSQLLPTPAKSHYTFNLRDLAKVFQGMLMLDMGKSRPQFEILRLWYHECKRVFADRLVNDQDRTWFDELLKERLVKDFDTSYDAIASEDMLVYGDFMVPNADPRMYEHIDNVEKMVLILQEYLEDYNALSTAQMKLVLFLDAVSHVTRISRVIRQPLGNALLLGVGGSGRQSLTRLAAHMAEYDLFQIELSKNYGVSEWREDLKNMLLKAGLQNKSIVFLFSDTQIKAESFLEDINNILNSGDVPNIYAFEDLDNIYTAMKPVVLDLGQQPTKTNLFGAYTKRVKNNTHTVICMSPIGEVFRARLRMFPALINCCTIDWFSEWPDEALQSVAKTFLSEIPGLEDGQVEGIIDGLVNTCVVIHQTVTNASKQYLIEQARYSYVTPTSYLELLGIFSKLINLKKEELEAARKRTKTGLTKLLNTQDDVAKMQAELETMKPMLEEATKDTEATMIQIDKDSVVAEQTREMVQKEESSASIMAEECKSIADDAQRDLNEALPALDAALKSLKSLNKNDVVEVRALQRPPNGVRMVIEAVCIMKAIKPKKVPHPDKAGVKIDDYWEPGKAILQDPTKFLDSLFKFDKDNISDDVIKKIQPYIDSEDFTPQAIQRVSKACTSICQWARAMHKYHFVSRSVAPKRARLKEAQTQLDTTMQILSDAKERLQEVEDRVATLQAKYDECLNKKEELENKTDLCQARLGRAGRLIGGLADEKIRWEETIETLTKRIGNVVGDLMLSAGCIAYLGIYSGEYRQSLQDKWEDYLIEMGVPLTPQVSLVTTLGDPVKIREWNIYGLPRDNLSTENGVIVQYSQRWPLFIDPQGQANKWVKVMERDNGIDVIKLTNRDFLRSLENAVRFGKPCLLENVGEELDPALEPILLQQTFKQQGGIVIKLGDTIIPYHPDFKLYITSKLPNPHYTPEVSTKVTIVNFTLSPSGLEDQLLGIVVAEERPDLEEAKNQLIVSNAKMKQEIKEIEDKILHRLSASEGSPVDDISLIDTLEISKVKAEEIKAKVLIAEQTERDIDETRSRYLPVAVRTQILFFCVVDLAKVDPMYQYSLEWYIKIFLNGIANAETSDDLNERIVNINEFFTFSLYVNVCRSVFEKDKLLFSFLLCVRILMHEKDINMDDWRFLIAGGMLPEKLIANAGEGWLSDRSWTELQALNLLGAFVGIADTFKEYEVAFRAYFDSPEPERAPLPGKWEQLTNFQKLLILKCIRPDKFTNAMQDFIANSLGEQFIEPQTTDLSLVYKDSSPTTPLIFVLSTGTDPAADLYAFAEEMKFSKKLTAISLGQGQGPRAEAMMRSAMERGRWVFFQNCHLAPSWMSSLEQLTENIDADKVHRDFRLWLTSMPTPKFPVAILQNGSKMTVEPPRGVKANLLKSYQQHNDEFLTSCTGRDVEFKALLFSLFMFNAVICERRKFGSLGFNIPYDFTAGDCNICVSQLNMFLQEYAPQVPLKVLHYTAGDINFGGRVTDDWDRRCINTILYGFYNKEVLTEGHKFSESGTYKQISHEAVFKDYIKSIKALPLNDSPELFGLHENANMTYAQNETFAILDKFLLMQAKTGGGGGKSQEEVIDETSKQILSKVPKPFDIVDLMERHPVMYEESMNTVLQQEVILYNTLLSLIHRSLGDLLKALKGLVVMSDQLERMSTSVFNNSVPDMWANKAYPSLKPLGSWVADLLTRLEFIKGWNKDGIPNVFWISGFFFPQAFITGALQNYARLTSISIDTIGFEYRVVPVTEEIKEKPKTGCYVSGFFVEGARWCSETHVLAESRPKELFTDMPTIQLIPAADREQPSSGIYICPVYKTLTRAGTLSTTGHSTNFVMPLELPSDKPPEHWIKRAVALICALDY
ncbi:dynein axonemal heavy chain 1-like isoform X3 [Bolinopsis microptera]|uniref:dynein axonemal heavy chain 1-like isoform X3 n=1 Tax=Bolinopsis microptera TaxID=2820187 RepID=UPI00307A586E